MVELWIPITIGAAFLQDLRSAAQKHLKGVMGTTFVRFGWFTAMTLQQAAVVKALAQVEMIFTFASSVFFFKETINRLEIAGCVLIVCGILTLIAIG